jgi:serine O-acetyltransferase
MTPERLWLLAIRLRRAGHPRLAKLLKQLNSVLFHTSLATGAIVARDVYLGHHGMGTVIHDRVTIGQRVKIWHNVTLTVRAPTAPEHRIVIGDGVTIGTGAIIITPKSQSLTIGNGAKVGAGAIVTHDVPPGATAISPAAHILQAKAESQ